MELKDTIEQMTSPDYKERFKAEYLQLKIRTEKLQKFINSIWSSRANGTEEPKHDCPLGTIETQYDRMCDYLQILRDRAKIEHIDLSEYELCHKEQ